MKVYVAFSIHGTNAFLVAVRSIQPVASGTEVFLIGSYAFRLATSRRPDHNPAQDGLKLHWGKLYRRTPYADGMYRPIKCPVKALSLFRKLEADGWTIFNREKFMERHANRFFKKPVAYEKE
jgi:hypothetical protein